MEITYPKETYMNQKRPTEENNILQKRPICSQRGTRRNRYTSKNDYVCQTRIQLTAATYLPKEMYVNPKKPTEETGI